MNETDKLSPSELLAAKVRWRDMAHLNAIEGNPFDAEDIAMFEMFDSEGWSHQRCLQYVLKRTRRDNVAHAAE
jgi:hypothetical protein